MIVTLDGQRVDVELEPGATLQDIIDQVRGNQPAQRIVVGVAINGQPCANAQLGERLAAGVDAGDQVDLESQHCDLIAADAFRAVAEQIAGIGEQQSEIAEQINAGKATEAVPRIGEFVTAWQLAQNVLVQNCQLTQRNLLEHEYEGKAITEHFTTLLARLSDIREALEGQDMVMLADIVNYETPELCGTWGGMLNHLADWLAEQAAAAPVA